MVAYLYLITICFMGYRRIFLHVNCTEQLIILICMYLFHKSSCASSAMNRIGMWVNQTMQGYLLDGLAYNLI